MTGRHIQKLPDGSWSYLDHTALFDKCRLHDLGTYIARRQGTLQKYLEDHKADLLQEVLEVHPSWDPAKVLWWKQQTLTLEEMRVLDERWLSSRS